MEFWNKKKHIWPHIKELIYTGLYDQALLLLNQDTDPGISLEYTIGEVNRIALPCVDKRIEIYITCNFDNQKKDLVQQYYDGFYNVFNDPDTFIYKYKAFHLKDPIPTEVVFNNYTVKYDAFKCQTNFGYGEQNQRLLNIVIMVEKDTADKVLVQKPITFIKPNGSKETLDKWIPSDQSIFVLLNAVLGEYNIVERIGYIDFLPQDDMTDFYDLEYLKTQMTILDVSLDAKKCRTCDRRHYQGKLFRCGKCKKVYYCGQECQKIDYQTHKVFCHSL